VKTPAPAAPLSRLLELSADATAAVRSGRSLTEVLAGTAADSRPGVQALTFQALRQYGLCSEVLRLLAPKAPAPKLHALLVVALALLLPDDAPAYAPHTLVDQAVRAAQRRSPAAAGFVNALLRRFLRERDALLEQARRAPVAAHNHPAWWIARLQRDWPENWGELLDAANRHPPMVLRVNRRWGSGADYLQRLAADGQQGWLVDDPALGGQAVCLQRPVPVQRLPGFADGQVSVQDAAAQRAAPLLLGAAPLPAGARVLDACAAPGGKTAHLLELADLDVLALDAEAQRLERVRDTLRRLGLNARVRCADALDAAGWWDGQPFDAVLLDAPCSASGIVRRHPDIRWLRREADIAALAALQARLLDTLWPLLKPGGHLLYATCSIFKAEGQAQIDAFLQRHGAGAAALSAASPGQLLPLADNRGLAGADGHSHDGFFYALIRKH
jgi:16S rRNA (cytosine967-C5)-methyltransferase